MTNRTDRPYEERFLLAFEDAIATRGPRKGRLKKKPPAFGSDAYIVYQALMLELMPINASVFSNVSAAMVDPDFYEFATNKAKRVSQEIAK